MIGRYALKVLHEAFGEKTEWVPQAVDAVMRAADLAIRHLSASNITQNAKSLRESDYEMPPRTKEELLATQELVANHRVVLPEDEPEDPAEELILKPERPRRRGQAPPNGWLL